MKHFKTVDVDRAGSIDRSTDISDRLKMIIIESKNSKMTKGMLSINKIRGDFRSWRAEQKMRAAARKLRRQFDRTYKEKARETGGTPEDYDIFKNLGRGIYGEVKLVKSKKSNALSAFKIMDTSKMEEDILEMEIKLMKSISHPFIVKMKGHFTLGDKMYLEMPYYACGDLHKLVKARGKCSEELARFYGAQLVMGIDFMHSVGVMHRDLKPENIMIEANGYIKIVDLGLAKKSDGGRLFTICGTEEYMAPEILLGIIAGRVPYTNSVDWWSYGVVMFNIITGVAPFPGEYDFLRVMSGGIRYPPNIDQGSKEYLEAQLRVSPEDRLGCRKEGAREIMKHPWFRGVDWTRLFFKKVKAPFTPEIWTGAECAAPNDNDMNCFSFMGDDDEDGG